MNMYSYKCCIASDQKTTNIKRLSKLLKIVSEHSRLQILCILNKGEHCVCELVEHIGLSQSLISHHLRDLKIIGIVVDRKDGKKVYYSLTTAGIRITNLIFQINN